MNKNFWSTLSAAALLAAGVLGARAQESRVSVGMRQYSDHSELDEFPFSEGDRSFSVAYEYHEGGAYWQLGLGYCTDVTNSLVDSVISPYVNLIKKDGFVRLGVGAMSSYVKSNSDGNEWLDWHWQLLAGITFPLFGMSLDVYALHVFDNWGDVVHDFDSGELDYAGSVSFGF